MILYMENTTTEEEVKKLREDWVRAHKKEKQEEPTMFEAFELMHKQDGTTEGKACDHSGQ
jgi:hypothetical protein